MPQATDFATRSLELRAKTIDADQRSVEATLSTETPVVMYDPVRGDFIPEVLLASGAEVPKSRQVPLLDSHNRSSTNDQLGSTRNIAVDGETLSGRLLFDESASQWSKVRDGHITDVSVGYEVKKRIYVEPGKTKTIGGRSFAGPVNVVTKWRLREVSITPIGADELAKMRGYRSAQRKGDWVMNEKLRKLCVSLGMPADLADQEAREWALENNEKIVERQVELRAAENKPTVKDNEELVAIRRALESNELLVKEMQAERKKEAEKAAFRKQVDTLLTVGKASHLKERAYACENEEAVLELIRKDQEANDDDFLVPADFARSGIGEAQIEKVDSAIRTALVLRALDSTRGGDDAAGRERHEKAIAEVFPESERSKDAKQLRNASLVDLARESVEARLGRAAVRGMSRQNIALCALGFYRQAGVRGEPAYHTTGSFANLTLDAVNKSMQVGYTEFPATWRGPMRQGSSVQDFKQKHTLRLGAAPNLPVWPDNENPKPVSMADARESYAVEARASELSFSWQTIVNEDMDQLSRAPQMLGTAASRTVNAVAWAQWTSNPTMSDGKALFLATAAGNRKRSNLTTGSVSDYTAAINTMTTKMMLMRGENTPEGNEGDDVLALMPTYIIMPASLRATLLQLVRSTSDPNADITNVANINTGLTPVIEPLLDAASTTAFYLSASTSQVDTVEVTFLQGQESPVVTDFMDQRNWSQVFTIVQTYAAKALNHRGVQKHDGA